MTDQAFFDSVLNATAVDSEGKKVGSVDQIYLDERTGEPTFVAVNTGLFGLKSSLVPLDGHAVQGDELRLAYAKDLITDAPSIADSDEGLSPEQEQTLYAHYGLTAPAYVDERQVAGHAERDVVATDTAAHRDERVAAERTHADDGAVIRHEEKLNVEKDRVATGRVHLRKYVVTEKKNIEVPVSREEIRVEREAISPEEAAKLGNGKIGEDSAEFVLHEERVNVEKETVPVEKVNVAKETVTDKETVSEDVRKERIDIDTEGDIDRDVRK